VSLQQATDNKLFGPVYHGTSSEKLEKIDKEGFRVFVGHARSGDIVNGFEVSDYSGGIPAPVHLLGFGVYFTTNRSIAKKFNGGTSVGLKTYFLHAPKMEIINWGSPNTMMKWWIKNGYDYKITPDTQFGGTRSEWGGTKNTLPSIREERLRATKQLTDELSSKWDAVWYKGKSRFSLLDGDQVCVYDPNNIYVMDKSLIKTGEIGSAVISKVGIDPYGRGEIKVPIGTKGIIVHKTSVASRCADHPDHWSCKECDEWYYDIKWSVGGHMCNVPDRWIEPYVKNRR
jgi:hypothetical protein